MWDGPHGIMQHTKCTTLTCCASTSMSKFKCPVLPFGRTRTGSQFTGGVPDCFVMTPILLQSCAHGATCATTGSGEQTVGAPTVLHLEPLVEIPETVTTEAIVLDADRVPSGANDLEDFERFQFKRKSTLLLGRWSRGQFRRPVNVSVVTQRQGRSDRQIQKTD